MVWVLVIVWCGRREIHLSMADSWKNILYIADNGKIIGGSEKSLLLLIKHLDRNRYHPFAVLFSHGSFEESLKKMGVPVKVLPLLSIERKRFPLVFLYVFYLLSLAYGVLRLSLFIKRYNIQLIHNNKVQCIFYSALSAWLCGIPLVWHERNFKRRLGRLGGLMVRLASRIIVISEAVGDGFRAYLDDAAKMKVIHNGVELMSGDLPPPKLRQTLGIPAETRLVGTLGRFTFWKGFEDFIEAARLVLKEKPDTIFLLVGDSFDPEDDAYQEKCKKLVLDYGLGDSIRFMGWTNNVVDVLTSLDVFVLPSWKEPFGRVIIEAMSCERAVVATRAGGVPEIVVDGTTGIMVPPRDQVKMAEAIIYLLDHEDEARQMGIDGHRRVEQCFSIGQHVELVQKLYDSLI